MHFSRTKYKIFLHKGTLPWTLGKGFASGPHQGPTPYKVGIDPTHGFSCFTLDVLNNSWKLTALSFIW